MQWFADIVDHLVGPPCIDFNCLTPLVVGLGASQVIGVIEIVVLLSLLARKTRKAAGGSISAALDCVLPAYKQALFCLITAFLLQLSILLFHVFLSFDPESLFYFFVYYSEQEAVTFFFLTPSVTSRSLRRAVIFALLWGFYAAVIAYIVAGQTMAESDSSHDIYDDFHTQQPSRVLYLFIDVPRLIAYIILVRFLSVRPRDSLLPYAVLQAVNAAVTSLYTLIYLIPLLDIRDWALWVPFVVMCGLTVISPWVIHSTFVLDSNYWRGVARPTRLRGFGVFIRMFRTNNNGRNSLASGYVDLGDHDEVDLWADLLTDSLVSKPLQDMLERHRNCLVDFAFVKIESKLLGKGMFAKVYRGRYKGVPCAIKIFLKQPEIDASSIKLFAEETQVALRLNHPNIVKFHGLCVRPPSVFLVFELCEQGDLFGVLAKRRLTAASPCTIHGWDLQRILKSCLEAAQAVAYIHSVDVDFIHRDIKSLNFLVTKQGDLKLTDFGTSRIMPKGRDPSLYQSHLSLNASQLEVKTCQSLNPRSSLPSILPSRLSPYEPPPPPLPPPASSSSTLFPPPRVNISMHNNTLPTIPDDTITPSSSSISLPSSSSSSSSNTIITISTPPELTPVSQTDTLTAQPPTSSSAPASSTAADLSSSSSSLPSASSSSSASLPPLSSCFFLPPSLALSSSSNSNISPPTLLPLSSASSSSASSSSLYSSSLPPPPLLPLSASSSLPPPPLGPSPASSNDGMTDHNNHNNSNNNTNNNNNNNNSSHAQNSSPSFVPLFSDPILVPGLSYNRSDPLPPSSCSVSTCGRPSSSSIGDEYSEQSDFSCPASLQDTSPSADISRKPTSQENLTRSSLRPSLRQSHASASATAWANLKRSIPFRFASSHEIGGRTVTRSIDPRYMTKGVGTRSWMAPEVVKGRSYGKASDVFSLCMVMWEIVTSREPYEDTEIINLRKVVQDLRADIRQVSLEVLDVEGPEVSAVWEELRVMIESGLALRPSERPSAEELVQRLQLLQKAQSDTKPFGRGDARSL